MIVYYIVNKRLFSIKVKQDYDKKLIEQWKKLFKPYGYDIINELMM